MSKSSSELELTWQWSAGRSPDHRILVSIKSLKEGDSGWFGINKSPSIADNLPDPMIVNASVLEGPEDWVGREVVLVIPRPELGDIQSGDKVGLGVINNDTCICAVKSPTLSDESALKAWTASFECQS